MAGYRRMVWNTSTRCQVDQSQVWSWYFSKSDGDLVPGFVRHAASHHKTAVRAERHRLSFLSISVKLTFGRSSGNNSRASRRRSSAVLTVRLPALVTVNAGARLSVTTRDWPGRSDFTRPG